MILKKEMERKGDTLFAAQNYRAALECYNNALLDLLELEDTVRVADPYERAYLISKIALVHALTLKNLSHKGPVQQNILLIIAKVESLCDESSASFSDALANQKLKDTCTNIQQARVHLYSNAALLNLNSALYFETRAETGSKISNFEKACDRMADALEYQQIAYNLSPLAGSSHEVMAKYHTTAAKLHERLSNAYYDQGVKTSSQQDLCHAARHNQKALELLHDEIGETHYPPTDQYVVSLHLRYLLICSKLYTLTSALVYLDIIHSYIDQHQLNSLPLSPTEQLQIKSQLLDLALEQCKVLPPNNPAAIDAYFNAKFIAVEIIELYTFTTHRASSNTLYQKARYIAGALSLEALLDKTPAGQSPHSCATSPGSNRSGSPMFFQRAPMTDDDDSDRATPPPSNSRR